MTRSSRGRVPSGSPTIVTVVTRTYVVGLALAAASIVLVSAVVGSGVVIWRDDQGALALGRTFATELDDHAPSSADRVVRHEIAEQHWSARRIEVWQGTDRLGAEEAEGTLREFGSRGSGACESTSIAGRSERVCVIHSRTGTAIVVASELGPMLVAMWPMLAAVASVALVVTLLFGLLGRRALAQSLAPLSRFEAEVAAVPARSGSRSVTHAWGSAEIDSLATTFNAMLGRIDEAIVREQRFVSDAAHELRTPLTRLRAQLELAREELREGKSIDARLVASVRTAVELADTTEALLAMARETMGTSEPVELADVIETCIARLESAEQGRIHFVRGASAIADGVEPLLVLATSNLVDNALKYGQGAIEVTLETEANQVVEIVVSDAGPGIPDDELTRIRAPFVRGTSSGAVRGAGLGLALADHVARLHEGSLVLENRTPRGFRARLAVRRWKAPDREQARGL